MPGKKKLSKAEKEKLKKEEQEKKELEEGEPLTEEERARLAEEEKKKKKEEQLLAVERKKLENEERKERRLDMTELTDMLTSNQQTLQAREDARRKEAKWARYMRCDGSPDPANQGEINTYINLKMENHERDDIESVLKDSQLDLALIEELEYLLSDTPLEDLPLEERQRYRETIGELQHLIQSKLDTASLHVLCDASRLQDAETSNLQYTLKNDTISLCTWGNLSKNPRIKSFEFTECGFAFDIPRLLTLSNCAMRYLHTRFDHYSPYSKAYYSRRKKKEEEVAPEPEAPPEEEKEKTEETEENKEGEEGAEGEPDALNTEASLEKPAQKDLMSALYGAAHPDEVKEEDAKPEEEEEVVEEDFEDPKTPEPQEWEDFDEEDDIVDLRAYHVVGGIFTFDLLNLPPQPKVCKNWTITQMVEPPKLDYMDYVADPPVASGQEKGKEKEQEKDKRDEKPPIHITINLPADVMFLEEPQVARWDAVKQYWRTDGFSNFTFDEENRTFKFSLSQFGTMCLLQDAHINMPFQSWELRPHKTNAAVLTIIAAIVELEIEIKDGLCCLSQPSDRSELAHLVNQWVTPPQLVENLRAAGINVFPQEDSSKYVTVQNKNPIVVERLYDQMGLVASAMAFSWSKWNGEVDSASIIMQGAEALQDEPLLEEDWSVFQANKRRFVRLKMTEFDETFSDEMADDIQFKSNLLHYTRMSASDEAKERVQETSLEFVDCVQQLLKATQVLTYA
ncbi:dynein axonemal intermediate chain 7-like isoform X2 [Babylonia areolata]|uniref:dynein axonemal intermediate chain 7-like isoform X2 n=1 Tax=Babylonia areolata TaxID=304850 RepID=UPI003FD4C848